MLFVPRLRTAVALALPTFAAVATLAVPAIAAPPASAAPQVRASAVSASPLAAVPPSPTPGSSDLGARLTSQPLATTQLTAPPPTPYAGSRVASDDPSSTATARRPWTDAFALDLSATTWVPLSVGPELAFELPGRVLAQVHLGWMPELYSHTMTNALEDAGAYDAEVGNLVDGVVQGATTWRIAAGWRPFESAGLELTFGYAHVALDGRTRTSELIPFVPSDVADELNAEVGDVGIDLDSSIHHFTIAAGWRWVIVDHLVIRANIGYLQAFGSSSRLDIEGRPDLTELAAPTVESVLHDHYMRYIKIPVVGLGVGYRFF
jgi:hypothetical protein